MNYHDYTRLNLRDIAHRLKQISSHVAQSAWTTDNPHTKARLMSDSQALGQIATEMRVAASEEGQP